MAYVVRPLTPFQTFVLIGWFISAADKRGFFLSYRRELELLVESTLVVMGVQVKKGACNTGLSVIYSFNRLSVDSVDESSFTHLANLQVLDLGTGNADLESEAEEGEETIEDERES